MVLVSFFKDIKLIKNDKTAGVDHPVLPARWQRRPGISFSTLMLRKITKMPITQHPLKLDNQ
jgi:hypothetical protein